MGKPTLWVARYSKFAVQNILCRCIVKGFQKLWLYFAVYHFLLKKKKKQKGKEKNRIVKQINKTKTGHVMRDCCDQDLDRTGHRIVDVDIPKTKAHFN